MSPWRVRITNGATYRPWVRLYMAQYAGSGSKGFYGFPNVIPSRLRHWTMPASGRWSSTRKGSPISKTARFTLSPMVKDPRCSPHTENPTVFICTNRLLTRAQIPNGRCRRWRRNSYEHKLQHHFSCHRARSTQKRPPYLPYKRRSRFGLYLGYPPKQSLYQEVSPP